MDDFKIEPKSGIPIWVQLRNRLIYLITSGYYQVGEQLPTLHSMATQLSINYNTVNKVYQSLERDGYIESRRGCGTIVVDAAPDGQTTGASTADLLTDEYFEKLSELGITPSEAVELVSKKAAAISQR